MKRYTITTLGCKVNQCESSALGHLLESSGYQNASSTAPSDLVVINSCTVTGKAAMQSRQAIRQARRNNPNARIVVTGCYAQTAPDEIRAIEGVDYIVGHADKLGIAKMLQRKEGLRGGPKLVRKNIKQTHCFDPMPSVAPDSRTRAYLKVQDGCNAFCTYCIVPHARGRSRSMPPQDVLHHLDELAQARFKEAVLTGIHLGAYGKDADPKSSLQELLYLITRLNPVPRLRISSIEPTEIESGIINLMADPQSPLCPHFHIPLQSGDDGILKRMGRPYTREQFSHTVREIRLRLPYAAIGVDVLVGFPGEDREAFARTFSLIDSLDVTYLHVFPFSARKGTPAAGYEDKVPDKVVKDRCQRMRALGEKKKADFYRANIHQEVKVLIENRDDRTGASSGMSENYLPVVLDKAGPEVNTIVTASIQTVEPDLTVRGMIVD